MNKKNELKAEERRAFFRVDDEVNLAYKKIDENQVIAGNRGVENILGVCSLSAALETVAQESAVLMHRLEKNYPDIADYLKLIDNKIELLAQAIVLQNGQFDKNDNRIANLSATGIAFDSQEAFREGDFLEVRIWLVNTMSVIVASGKVVYCKANQPNEGRYPYFIGVDYINVSDQDRELLIKHVVKRQLQQIRDKKENSLNQQ